MLLVRNFVIMFSVVAILFLNNATAQKADSDMGGGFFRKLFFKNEPDYVFQSIDEIKLYQKPLIPVKNREEFVKLFFSNKDVQEHLFLSITGSHKDLGWNVYVDKKQGGWLFKMRSVTSLPEYKCYFAINSIGEEVNIDMPYRGCKYYSNK